jgi:hypothetical protein
MAMLTPSGYFEETSGPVWTYATEVPAEDYIIPESQPQSTSNQLGINWFAYGICRCYQIDIP